MYTNLAQFMQVCDCEYCGKNGGQKTAVMMCHGIYVCVDHIEDAQSEWAARQEGC